MILARVTGTVVATHKSPHLAGRPFLLLEKVDPATLQGKADFLVAVDSVGADAGEVVLVVTGSSARMTEATQGRPADATIIAIVDLIDCAGAVTYRKHQPGSPVP